MSAEHCKPSQLQNVGEAKKKRSSKENMSVKVHCRQLVGSKLQLRQASGIYFGKPKFGYHFWSFLFPHSLCASVDPNSKSTNGPSWNRPPLFFWYLMVLMALGPWPSETGILSNCLHTKTSSDNLEKNALKWYIGYISQPPQTVICFFFSGNFLVVTTREKRIHTLPSPGSSDRNRETARFSFFLSSWVVSTNYQF